MNLKIDIVINSSNNSFIFRKISINLYNITGKQFAVPRHKAEIPTGTANKILKDAGLK